MPGHAVVVPVAVAAVALTAWCLALPGADDARAAAPTTTLAAAPTTAAAPAPTTVAPPTTVSASAPTTATATTVAPTTVPGPAPRGSIRVASAVDTEKIRATSLPLRTMGISLAAVVVALSATGFVYGKVRSRIPAAAIPRAAAGDPPAASTSMPPPAPAALPLPPPVVEDAIADTVIFEPPPSHSVPQFITPPAGETTDDD